MASTYIKVPHYVAAYHRNKDPFHTIDPSQPVMIDTSQELLWPVLCNFIYNNTKGDIICAGATFSQRQWRRMMQGCYLQQSRHAARRNMKGITHLDDELVHELAGITTTPADENSEYLCIQLPREVMRYPNLCRTSDTWMLSVEGVRRLRKELTDEFWVAFFYHMRHQNHYCILTRKKRTDTEMIDRFFSKYDIRESANGCERKAIKRNFYRKRKIYKVPTEAFELGNFKTRKTPK